MSRGSAVLAVIVAGVLFSTGGAAVKLTEWGAWQVAATRSAVAAAFLFALLPEARRARSLRCLPVAIAYAATLVLFVHANKLTTAAATTFLQATSPVWVVVLGPLLLRERPRRVDALLLPVFVLGLVILVGSATTVGVTAPAPSLGNLLAALSGLSYALTVVGIRALQSRPGRGGGASAVALGNLLAAILCLPWAIPLAGPELVDVSVTLFLGAFQIGLAYVFLVRAAGVLSALEVALILLLEPVLSPVWAYLVHAEAPGVPVFLGGALIVGATLFKVAWEAGSSGGGRLPGQPGGPP